MVIDVKLGRCISRRSIVYGMDRSAGKDHYLGSEGHIQHKPFQREPILSRL